MRLGKYAVGYQLQIPKLKTEEGRLKVQSDRGLRRLQRIFNSKVSHMCNLQFSTGTDKKKGPHDEAGDGEDGNDITTTDEMNFLINIKKHVASNFAKDLNPGLVEGYAKCSVPQIDLVEIIIGGDGRSFTKDFPMMDLFNIPLIPVIIRKLLQNVVKLNQMYPDLNLLSFDTFGDDAMNVLVAFPQASTRDVFVNKGSRATFCKIPEMLVNNSELKNIKNEEDKKKAIEEETLKRTKRIIESFMKNDQRVANIITDIAREELGLIRAKMMKEEGIVAILKIVNVSQTAFRKLRLFMELHWGWRMFASKYDIRSLRLNAILPIIGCCDVNPQLIINYWYKKFIPLITQAMVELFEVEDNYAQSTNRIHFICSCDHGQGALRSCAKILSLDQDSLSAKVIAERVYTVGNVDHNKDNYKIMENTLMSHYNIFM